MERQAFVGEEEVMRMNAELATRRDFTVEDIEKLPEGVRAELIDGQIFYFAAPKLIHQRLSGKLYRKIADYIEKNSGNCEAFFAPVGVRLVEDAKNHLEPDVIVVCDRDKIIDRCLYGAPDFVVEVLSPSSTKRDTAIKLRKYKEAGVKEYWMVDPDKKKVIVYDWTKSEIPMVYGFDSKAPVGIFCGECEIDFAEIYEEIKFLYEKE